MSTTALAEVGLKAIIHQQAHAARRTAFVAFCDACQQWKQENGHGRLDRHTPEWDAMLEGVSTELAALSRAKAEERNSRERLFRACRRAAK